MNDLRDGPGPRWRDALICFCLALATQAVYRVAWPPERGRDFVTYTMYYVEFWRSDLRLPFIMNFRTPLAPFFIGGLAELGGLRAVSVGLSICYASAAASTYLLGAFWNRQTGWLSALAVLAYPAYGALFHEIASDAVFAAAFIVWTAMICWTTSRQTPRWYATHAVAVVVLTLIRPSSLCFLVFVAFPWLIDALPTRIRVRCAATFAATAGVLLAAWCSYHAVRFGDFSVARGNAAITPLSRAMTERIVRSGNGPASQLLARAMEMDLITYEPYRSLGVTADGALASGDDRVWSDLVSLSDRTWGWNSNYAILRQVGIEAVRAHPWPYLASLGHDLAAFMGLVGYAPNATGAPAMIRVGTTEVPPPAEGIPEFPTVRILPRSYVNWSMSTPDGHVTPIDSIRSEPRLRRIEDGLRPPQPGSPKAAKALNAIGKMFPPPIVWLIAGVVGTARMRTRQRRVHLALIGMSMMLIVATLAAAGFIYHYRLPFDPLFIVFGVAGFVRHGLTA